MKFMKLTKWQIAITSICMITGLMLTVTLQAQEKTRVNPTSSRSETLASITEKLQQEVALLEVELIDLRKELTKNQESVVGNTDELTLLQNELQKAKIEAGLVPVSGPGLIFTLDDRNDALKNDIALAQKGGQVITDYWPYLVHDSYLLNIVNDLRNAGAEAISINGERVFSATEIKCGGYIVFVNGQQLGAPYKIEAIGDFSRLQEGIENGYTFGVIKANDYPIKIEESNKLVLPAYTSSYNLKFTVLDSAETEKEGGN